MWNFDDRKPLNISVCFEPSIKQTSKVNQTDFSKTADDE